MLLLSATLLIGGGGLAAWAFTHLPDHLPGGVAIAVPALEIAEFMAAPSNVATISDRVVATVTPVVALRPVLRVALGEGLPAGLVHAVVALETDPGGIAVTRDLAGPHHLRFDFGPQGRPVYRQLFAAATRFDTIEPSIAMQELRQSWRGEDGGYARTAVLSDTLPALEQVLGSASGEVAGFADMAGILDAAWSVTPTLVLLPFDQLTPELVVLAVGGQNPVENAAKFDADLYPLVATVYAAPGDLATGDGEADALLDRLPSGNRDAERLTVVAMTGVTAMVRLTAAQMDRLGAVWPAEVIGPELAAADITVVSNEVPFITGCVTNTSADNLTFCSKPEYLDALTALGVDIVGLTGNHQNDFGREDALRSLELYAEAALPLYGGGRNLEEAAAPLVLEHHGNRLAFLGANSFGPPSAWATDELPGSAPFDLNILSATIRNIKEQERADVVLAELQYQETYDTEPIYAQRQDFGALVRAGADIVTGVQSHVPQAMQFLDGKLILYGLGNLFFDQMWSQPTRQGLIAKHTIYDGRHISTQLLTTLLHDYGQPHWAEPDERASILERVFAYSRWE